MLHLCTSWNINCMLYMCIGQCDEILQLCMLCAACIAMHSLQHVQSPCMSCHWPFHMFQMRDEHAVSLDYLLCLLLIYTMTLWLGVITLSADVFMWAFTCTARELPLQPHEPPAILLCREKETKRKSDNSVFIECMANKD